MATDPRLHGKSPVNPGTLPVMIYDYRKLPQIATNVWHAQHAGWDAILTYDAPLHGGMGKNAKRYASIIQAGVIRSRESSADKYPFASTVENAGSVWIGHAPEAEQRSQGGLISAFYSKNDAAGLSVTRPFWFEVKVINFPAEMHVNRR